MACNADFSFEKLDNEQKDKPDDASNLKELVILETL